MQRRTFIQSLGAGGVVALAPNPVEAKMLTEHPLIRVDQDVGIYIVAVDLSNMMDGDFLTIHIKLKLLNEYVTDCSAHYAHKQFPSIFQSHPLVSSSPLVVTLTQTAGTPRSFKWKITKI